MYHVRISWFTKIFTQSFGRRPAAVVPAILSSSYTGLASSSPISARGFASWYPTHLRSFWSLSSDPGDCPMCSSCADIRGSTHESGMNRHDVVNLCRLGESKFKLEVVAAPVQDELRRSCNRDSRLLLPTIRTWPIPLWYYVLFCLEHRLMLHYLIFLRCHARWHMRTRLTYCSQRYHACTRPSSEPVGT